MHIQFQNAHITVFQSALFRTTCTVIAFDKSVMIVDPNWLPDEVDFIKNFVESTYNGFNIYLLFTHSDFDHIIGYGRFESAKVIASSKFVTNPNKDDILRQIAAFDDEFYIRRTYPIEYPMVDIEIRYDGQSLEIDGEELIFILAPGHVADGVMMIIPSKFCWVVGDYLSNVEIPFVDDDFNDYFSTLTKAGKFLMDYTSIELLIPGHGDVATSRIEIQNRIQCDLSYLQLLSAEDEPNAKGHLKQYYFDKEMQKAHQKNKNMVWRK